MAEKPVITEGLVVQTRPGHVTIPENTIAIVNDNGTLKSQTPDGTLSPLGGGGSGLNQLTGDVAAGPGTGSQAATIQPGVVTLAKMANLTANSIIGNATGSLGPATALTTLPTSTFPALTGDITTTAGSLATTLANLPLSVFKARLNAIGGGPALLKYASDGTPSAAVSNVDYSPAAWAQQRMPAILAIAPTLTRAIPFDCTSITKDLETASGVGSGLCIPNTSINGGGLRVKSGGTASSNQYGRSRDLTATNPPNYVTNIKTQAWAYMARINIQTTPDSHTILICGGPYVAGGAVEIQMLADGSTSLTNWTLWVNGVGSTKVNTLQTLDLTNWHNVGMVFDGTTLWLVVDDVKVSTGLTDLTNFGTANIAGFRFAAANGSTAANQEFWIDQLALFTPAGG